MPSSASVPFVAKKTDETVLSIRLHSAVFAPGDVVRGTLSVAAAAWLECASVRVEVTATKTAQLAVDEYRVVNTKPHAANGSFTHYRGVQVIPDGGGLELALGEEGHYEFEVPIPVDAPLSRELTMRGGGGFFDLSYRVTGILEDVKGPGWPVGSLTRSEAILVLPVVLRSHYTTYCLVAGKPASVTARLGKRMPAGAVADVDGAPRFTYPNHTDGQTGRP